MSRGDPEGQVDPASSAVDRILADYHLDNDENGVDVVAEINGRWRCPAPVVMITANYTKEVKQHIRELGHLLMNQPVKPLKLRSALSHLLRS